MSGDGVVLLDKPVGITSRRALDTPLKILGVKKGGHFGSLDPFATGLLCIGVGHGTKLLPFMQSHQKEYIALIGFEMFTDTDDITGQALENFDVKDFGLMKAREWISANTGWVNQVPPQYCAQKHQGKPLYKLKRASREVDPRPKEIYIEQMEVMDYGADFLKIRVVCSRGTYIRSIARDLGKFLGCGGYLRELRRLKSEGFSIQDAYTFEALRENVNDGKDVMIPMHKAVNIPSVRATQRGEKEIMDGRPITTSNIIDDTSDLTDGYAAVLSEDGSRLICAARVEKTGGILGYIERGFWQD